MILHQVYTGNCKWTQGGAVKLIKKKHTEELEDNSGEGDPGGLERMELSGFQENMLAWNSQARKNKNK